MRKHLRSLMVLWEDCVWPGGGLEGPNPEESVRHSAIAEVLCCLPHDDYVRLRDDEGCSFEWFIPHLGMRGGCWPFFPNVPKQKQKQKHKGGLWIREHARVLYLSPMLERRAFSSALGVVAHELAHIALKHELLGSGDCSAQEVSRGFQRFSKT